MLGSIELCLVSICIHGNAWMVCSSFKTLRAVKTLILFWIKLQSGRASLTNMLLIIMYGLIFGTNTVLVALVPNHVVWTAFTHFVLCIVLWWSGRAFPTFLIDFVVILIFISLAFIVRMVLLMQGLYESNKEEEPKYFFIHLNKNYIWNLIWIHYTIETKSMKNQ